MDVSNLEKTVWTLKREVHKWVTNGQEVVFIEKFEDKFWLYHINETGEVKSVELKIANRYRSVSALWILDHIIVIDLDDEDMPLSETPVLDSMGLVCAVYKDNMQESVLFSRPPYNDEGIGYTMWKSKFHPKKGVFFATCLANR